MNSKVLMATFLSGMVLMAGAASAQEGRERPDFATLDINEDGGITQEELQARGQARFDDVDADGDGALSVEELVAQAQTRAQERAEQMIARLDANEDGVLQADEMQERGGDRMARMFERLDADEDGAISEAEFEEAKKRMRGRRGDGPRRDRG